MDPASVRYQLWAGEVEVEALGLVAQRVVELGGGISVGLSAVGCGHVVEFHERAGGRKATEVVAAVQPSPEPGPVADLAIAEATAAREYQVEGLRVRAACRLVELSPGRVRWLASVAADPALRGRIVTVTAPGSPTDLRVVLTAPPAVAAGTRVVSALVLPRQGKVLLTETMVFPC